MTQNITSQTELPHPLRRQQCTDQQHMNQQCHVGGSRALTSKLGKLRCAVVGDGCSTGGVCGQSALGAPHALATHTKQEVGAD